MKIETDDLLKLGEEVFTDFREELGPAFEKLKADDQIIARDACALYARALTWHVNGHAAEDIKRRSLATLGALAFGAEVKMEEVLKKSAQKALTRILQFALTAALAAF